MMVLKPKKCAVCKTEFIPHRIGQKVCSPAHALDLVQKKRAAQDRKDLAMTRKALKSRADWMREAQAAFNAFIRERDRGEPCISCGRFHDGQWHAGHYRTTKAAPELRFNELNVHRQCQPCNTHLSGNVVEYRINLIRKIGLEKVESLEGLHNPKRYTIDELKEIKSAYTKKRKELMSAK